MIEAGHGVHRLLNGARYHDLHLIDRHDAVIDADDDAREVCGREDGNRNSKSEISAEYREGDDDEDNRACGIARSSDQVNRSFAPVERQVRGRSLAVVLALGTGLGFGDLNFHFVIEPQGALRDHLFAGIDAAEDLHVVS